MTVDNLQKNITAKSAKAVLMGAVVFLTLGVGGCSIFGGDDDNVANVEAAEEVYQIGVNAYLWRASLDTLSFMPISSADNKGGVILTDWKINPGNNDERTKVDILIVGRKLTADSLKVTVHRQVRNGDSWLDQAPRPGASINISNAILMQARLLRRDNAPIK